MNMNNAELEQAYKDMLIKRLEYVRAINNELGKEVVDKLEQEHRELQAIYEKLYYKK